MKKRALKVFVGLSGGVDSAVSAYLLQKAGHDVTGVFIKGWYPEWLPCTWREERRDAMRVAAHLGISFLTCDAEAEYRDSVAHHMIAEYKAGRTPNPDVLCNKEIKFGTFFRFALNHGADVIATGHYAQVSDGVLKEGVDKEKDQSYFLWTIPGEILQKVMFPIGGYKKSVVRTFATKAGLPNAQKKDSQGICFLGEVDMKEFLRHYIPSEKGLVFDVHGNTIGEHDGATFFTIGERHGFILYTPSPTPLYVVAKDIAANTITVSARITGDVSTKTKKIELQDLVLRKELTESDTVLVRIRYRQEPQTGTLKHVGSGSMTITFDTAQDGVAPGQSAVIYIKDECVGGGIIRTCRS
ncbi:MAG TPA: tRNA 2-thiouridine(34) synthase MnmA [Candidatus Paceibacterota bacterium]|nr:tRNA 2-thiouridine(34) synthase MnmA [Candidatus Paceibacterota bacterium]